MISRILFLIIPVSFILASCGSTDQAKENAASETFENTSVKPGGAFKMNETEMYQTLYPYAVVDAISYNLTQQIYEGLVKFDPKTLKLVPALATKWVADANGKTFTFHLKKGVFFHDDPCFPQGKGREVKAADFKYSFEQLCTQSGDNFTFGTTFKDRLAGANEYYEASSKGRPSFDLKGVKVIDDYTLQVELEEPNLSYLDILAHTSASVVAKEAVEQYGNMLHNGTGPFVFNEKSNSERVILTKNKNYHRSDSLGRKLPYLDSVVVTFIDTKRGELEAFNSGKIDMVYGLPSESVNEFLSKQIDEFQRNPPRFVLQRTPEMSSQFYEFNLTNPVLKNVKVRQAMNYAINREKIVADILKNQAYGPGTSGITSPSFKGYDINKIVGYDHNPERAKKLLAEAGYPNGKNFPNLKLQINSGGLRHTNVATEIQKQLREVLNINLVLEVVPLAKKLEDSKYARSDISRSGWSADYPSPESFLTLFYGKTVPAKTDQPSYPNMTRYVNPKFDEVFDKGRRAKTLEESYKYFMEAEQIAMKDAPVMVLWYDENYRLLNAKIKNYPTTALNYRSLAEVYIDASSAVPTDSKLKGTK